MKHRFRYLWLLLLVLFGFSCSQSNDPVVEPVQKSDAFLSTEFSTELSDAEAIKQAESIYGIIANKDGFRASSPPRVKDVLRSKASDSFRSSDGDSTSKAGLVVVNFEDNKGFVLLSDNKLAEPLLGFSDKGYLDLNNPQNPAFSLILEAETSGGPNQKGGIGPKYCSKCGSLIPPPDALQVITKVTELPCSEFYCNQNFRRDQKEISFQYWKKSHTIEYGAFKLIVSHGPLLQVEWDQYKPHNLKLKKKWSSKLEKYVLPPVGCVATAMAQIMTYHKYPTERWGKVIDWDRLINDINSLYSMDISSSLHEELGRPGLLNMKYDLSGSGASSKYVPRTFRAFGYKSSELIDYYLGSIQTEISEKRPVYMRGHSVVNGGHAWVVDGWLVLERQVTVRNKITGNITMQYSEVKHFIHCNLGWGYMSYNPEDKELGVNNGYYLSKGFNFSKGRLLEGDSRTVKLGRDFKTDSLDAMFDKSFSIVKNISR